MADQVILHIWRLIDEVFIYSIKDESYELNANCWFVEDTIEYLRVHLIFRWFKFTLKPPYSIAHDNLQLAIWDTSFWTFWLKFGHKGSWHIS